MHSVFLLHLILSDTFLLNQEIFVWSDTLLVFKGACISSMDDNMEL